MEFNIIKIRPKHTYKVLNILIFSLLFMFFSCHSEKKTTQASAPSKPQKNIRELSGTKLNAQLITPKGQKIRLRMAISDEDQTQGLSGVQPEDFQLDEGMLFFNTYDQIRGFWMPDTYFDLHIIFLDKNFNIVYIEENTPHHPGREDLDKVFRTKQVNCRHVLELKSSSPIAQSLKVGDQLKWLAPITPEQIESSIHRQQ